MSQPRESPFFASGTAPGGALLWRRRAAAARGEVSHEMHDPMHVVADCVLRGTTRWIMSIGVGGLGAAAS